MRHDGQLFVLSTAVLEEANTDPEHTGSRPSVRYVGPTVPQAQRHGEPPEYFVCSREKWIWRSTESGSPLFSDQLRSLAASPPPDLRRLVRGVVRTEYLIRLLPGQNPRNTGAQLDRTAGARDSVSFAWPTRHHQISKWNRKAGVTQGSSRRRRNMGRKHLTASVQRRWAPRTVSNEPRADSSPPMFSTAIRRVCGRSAPNECSNCVRVGPLTFPPARCTSSFVFQPH